MKKRNPYNYGLSEEKRFHLKSSNIPDSKFNSTQLSKGTKVEFEHTNNPFIAKSIAKAHLSENPDYYKYDKGKGKEYLTTQHPKSLFEDNK